MKLFKLTLVALASAAITGCGGEGGPLTASGGSVAQGQVQAALSQVDSALDTFSLDTNPSFPQIGGNSISVDPNPSVTWWDHGACTTVTPTPLVDADSDGISLLKKYTYDCDNIVDGEYIYSVNGSITMKDLDDTKRWMEGGYRADYDTLYTFNGVPGVDEMSYEDVGYFELKKVGGSFVYDSEYRSNGTGVYHGRSHEVIWQSTWNHSVTPDPSGTNMWDKGSISFSGFFGLQGQFQHDDPFSVVFEISSNNLKYDYDSGCNTYQSGSITFEDGNGNRIVLTYACTSVTGTFNGQTVDLRSATAVKAGKKTRLGSLF